MPDGRWSNGTWYTSTHGPVSPARSTASSPACPCPPSPFPTHTAGNSHPTQSLPPPAPQRCKGLSANQCRPELILILFQNESQNERGLGGMLILLSSSEGQSSRLFSGIRVYFGVTHTNVSEIILCISIK